MSSKLTLQMGLRWEYLGPWNEQNNQEGSFDAATGKIAFNVVPSNLPAQLVPLIINQNGFFPPGILQKDLNNWGPRIGAAYTVNDNTVVRSGFGMYYDNLNLNELQFSRLVPPFYGQYSLQPTRTDLSMQVDTLFPDLNNIPQFPAPFSMDPTNRTAYTVQWNGNVQRTLGNHYVFEVAYTGSRSYNEHKRYNINQAQPGTTPIATRVPYPAFQSAILYSSDGGWARFNGLSLRLEKRYSNGLFFLGNYQLSKSIDNGSGEVEANDTAFAWNLNADESYSRYDQRHRAAISWGYELPFGPGKALLSNGGALAYVFGGWQVQGIIRLGSGFPLTVTSTNVCQCGSFVPQRVNIVTSGNFGILDDPTVTHWFDQTAYAVPANGTQGNAGRNTIRGPGTQQVNLSLSKRFPINRARLESHLLANNAHANVRAHAVALSDATGTATLYHPTDWAKNHGEASLYPPAGAICSWGCAWRGKPRKHERHEEKQTMENAQRAEGKPLRHRDTERLDSAASLARRARSDSDANASQQRITWLAFASDPAAHAGLLRRPAAESIGVSSARSAFSVVISCISWFRGFRDLSVIYPFAVWQDSF